AAPLRRFDPRGGRRRAARTARRGPGGAVTSTATVMGLVVLLLAGAAAGPWALGRLGPTLARYPRTGIAAWTAGAALWVLGLLALGPLVGWVAGGPGLPGAAGAVCRRCLEASNPF